MTTCWHCSNTGIQPLTLTSTKCLECAHLPRLERLAARYTNWRKWNKKTAEKWLCGVFPPDEQTEIRRLAGTAVQLELF